MASKRRKWTDEDRQFLKDNYQKMTNREFGEHFGITGAGIGYQLKKLGLKRERRWTEEKDDFLRNNYLKMINRELARELRKTICAIEKRLGTLNLRRLEKWTPEREQFLRDNYGVCQTLFSPKSSGSRSLL